MAAPEPPDDLGELGKMAFHTAYTEAMARGYWDPEFTLALWQLARVTAHYIAFAQQVAQIDPARVGDDLRASIAEARTLARECMAEFRLIPKERVRLGEVRLDGLDADLARLCGVPDVADLG